MSEAQIARVRRFNRAVTQRVGALNDRFLARGRPLHEARVLWEIGTHGCEVRTLRKRLELDSGQLSRLLRSLESNGLVEVVPSPADGRIRVARPTRAGVAERALLDKRSDGLAASILATFDDGERAQLLDAMRVVERMLTAGAIEIREVDPSHPDARQCLRAYFAELDRRSDSGFDPETSRSAEPHQITPPAGCLLIAYLRSEPVGCGAVKHPPDAPSEIKRMWVSPDARGLGLGRRILSELETRAAARGASTVRLDTNGALIEALALYRSSGYREVSRFNDEPFADRWFEKPLPAVSRPA